jgi:hypothetical protein
MKKILIVSGIVFWVLIFIVAAFFIWGMYLDTTSKAFVDQNVPVIISTWSEQELLKKASPELKAVVSNEQSDKTWTGFTKLGALKKYKGSKGSSYQNAAFLTGKNGKRGYEITAKYVAEADFQNGRAKISIDLIRQSGEWKFYSFYVDSPLTKGN